MDWFLGFLLSHSMHLTQNFLIFTKFVSPLEKPRKRPQEIENQKDIEQSSFQMQFPGLFSENQSAMAAVNTASLNGSKVFRSDLCNAMCDPAGVEDSDFDHF
jgi:hypothetical protein